MEGLVLGADLVGRLLQCVVGRSSPATANRVPSGGSC
jgi:hypothetical protein